MKLTLVKTIITVCCLVFGFTAFAFESHGPYAGGSLGVSLLNDGEVRETGFKAEASFDTGVALEAFVGYDFHIVRLEAEIARSSNKFDSISAYGRTLNADGTFSSTSLLGNVYFDLENDSKFKPYVMGGLGIASIDVDELKIGGSTVGTEKDTVFAYQIGAGLNYQFNKKFICDLTYKYFKTSTPEFGGVTEIEYAGNRILLGIIVLFGEN